jgi:tRNA (mo5U34)-methyltransferase
MPKLTELTDEADRYGKSLVDLKERLGPQCDWYPYSIIGNMHHLRTLLENSEHAGFFEDLAGAGVVDVGGADGDLSFFFESLGCDVDLIDNSGTSRGVRSAIRLREALESHINIYDVDIDGQFGMPRERYDLALFLGTLYHLKNPFYALERVAEHAKHCFLSTRIARFTPDGLAMKSNPLAYLLDADESNNDSTNYWIFSEAGLRRVLERSGWTALAFMSVGDVKRSNPRDNEHDERAFCFLRSRRCD